MKDANGNWDYDRISKLTFQISLACVFAGAFFALGAWMVATKPAPYFWMREMWRAAKEMVAADDISRLDVFDAPEGATQTPRLAAGELVVGPCILMTSRRGERQGLYWLDGAGAIVASIDSGDEYFGLSFDALDWTSAGVSDRREAIWHGFDLTDDGVILAISGMSTPYGIGLVRLGYDGSVRWAREIGAHHSVMGRDDGNYVVTTMHLNTTGNPGSPNFTPPFMEDEVSIIAPDGTELDRFSLMSALAHSDYRGFLSANYDLPVTIGTRDPFHTNKASPLPQELAAMFPMFEAGDLLVSIRHLNAVFVIDPETRAVRKAFAGPFVRQHAPVWGHDGRIYVFSNQSAARDFSASEILGIDPASGAVAWRWQGDGREPFFSEYRGDLAWVAPGKLLVTETNRGRVFILDVATGAILWDYRNIYRDDEGTLKIGAVMNARNAPCPEIAR